jgi:Family of unknown function (DUF6893)
MSTLIKVGVAAAVVALVISALPDLKRYMEISQM